jgi:hypothetical protein
LAIEATAVVGFVGGGLVIAGGAAGADRRWSGIIWSISTGAVAVALARAIFRKLSRSGCVVVTAQGVAAAGRFVRWEEIRAVRRQKDGVYLRLRSSEPKRRPLAVDSPQCSVADERLVQVIEFYLTNPHRRSALDTGPAQLALAVSGAVSSPGAEARRSSQSR